MYHQGSEKCPSPNDFLILCKRLISDLYPRINISEYQRIVSEGLSGRTVRCDFFNLIDHLGQIIPKNLDIIKKAAQYICRKVNYITDDETEPKFIIGEIVQSLKTARFVLPLRVMQAIFEDPENAKKIFHKNINDALKIFWVHLISWQNRYFLNRPAKCIINAVKEIQKELLEKIITSTESKDKDTEAYAFLESLLFPNDNVKFRLCLPNWIIISDDSNEPENEYDVISFTINKYDEVETWIWGCTTSKNIDLKRSEDTLKIQKLKDSLNQRWAGGGGIRTVQNYVHKENNYLCLEINGRQKKLSLEDKT